MLNHLFQNTGARGPKCWQCLYLFRFCCKMASLRGRTGHSHGFPDGVDAKSKRRTLPTLHSTLLYTSLYCTLYCTVYTVVYTVHSSVHCTLHSVHCTLPTLHSTVSRSMSTAASLSTVSEDKLSWWKYSCASRILHKKRHNKWSKFKMGKNATN